MTAQLARNYISYVDGSGNSHSGSDCMAFFESMLAITKELPGGNTEKGSTSLSGGSFSVVDDYCVYPLDTSGGGPTDTLTNIGGATLRDGMIIGIRVTDPSRIITISHNAGGAGQIFLSLLRAKTMRTVNRYIWLRYNLSATAWYEVWSDYSDVLNRLAGTQAINTLTVAGGTVTPTGSVFKLTAASAQNLNFIAQTNYPEADSSLLFVSVDSASVGPITVQHNQTGTGKILLNDATSFVIFLGQTLILRKDGTTWVEVGRVGSFPAPAQGCIPVGTGSTAAFANLAAPTAKYQKLASNMGAQSLMGFALDPFAGVRVLTPGSDPTTYSPVVSDESWTTFDLTSGSAIINLPSLASNTGKEWSFYIGANPNGKTLTVNSFAGETLGKTLATSQILTAVGDLITIQSDGSVNGKICIDSRSTVVKPIYVGKNKVVDQGTYQSMTVQLSNGQLVQAGLAIGLARGTSDQNQQFGPVQWDAINPPPANSTIVDWCFTGSNLFVVLSNGWVYGAGQNAGGQLGQGDTTARYVLTRIPYFFSNGITVKKVYAFCNGQADSTIASVYFWGTLAGTNYVYAVGANTGGQLGNGAVLNISTPVQVYNAGANTVLDIQCAMPNSANAYAAILLSSGLMYVTGVNASGQLGQGNTTALTSFTNVPGLTGITAIRLFASTNGATYYPLMMAITSASSGSIFVWGYNASYQGANGGTAVKSSPGTALLANVADGGFIGGLTAIGVWARKNDGTLWTWGDGANNILFGGNTTTIQTPPTNPVAHSSSSFEPTRFGSRPRPHRPR